MKFQADREVLGEAISFVVRLMSPKPQLPQLSGVMITAGNNEVILSIFDYEVSAKVSIAAAVDAPGKVLVQGRLLAEIVSKLPGETVSLALQESRLQLTSASSKFTLSSMSFSDYPEIPAMPGATGSVAAKIAPNVMQRSKLQPYGKTKYATNAVNVVPASTIGKANATNCQNDFLKR